MVLKTNGDESTTDLAFVTIISPCRNEEKFIGQCLDSIIINDYPKGRLEVLVVDGESTDGTKEILLEYVRKYPFISFLNNPKRIVPAALNIGLKAATGDIIARMDAHCVYPPDYIRRLVKGHIENNADNIGGICETVPADSSLKSKGIAAAMGSVFGVGLSFRTVAPKKPKYVDTVPFGSWKRTLFDRVGLFDERFTRAQDLEHNVRIRKAGGKILALPTITVKYFGRESYRKLWAMFYQYGYWKNMVNKKHNTLSSWRQLIPAVFVGILIALLILTIFYQPFFWAFLFVFCSYVAANLVASLLISLREGFKYFLVLPLAFGTLHFSYGLGYLRGVCDFLILGKHKRNKIKDMPLTR